VNTYKPGTSEEETLDESMVSRLRTKAGKLQIWENFVKPIPFQFDLAIFTLLYIQSSVNRYLYYIVGGEYLRISWDRCYDFINIFAEKFSQIFGVFLVNLLLVFAKL
jgi:hypothetical protein